MNIAVIAANGRSGKVFVEAALKQGHTVRAGIRGTNTLNEHSRLTIVECDATNEDQVRQLLDNQDAVVSLIGHVRHSPQNVQTDAIKTIIKVMRSNNQRRIISLTGTGVRFDGDHITLIDRILNASIGIIDTARIADGKNHVEVLKDSGLDWTAVRVLKLKNGASHAFELKENGPTKPVVSRAEVAQAILQVVEAYSYVQKAPIIGSKR